jgi:hypothetical protein
MPVVKISIRITFTLALIAGFSIAAISYAPASAQETRESGRQFGRAEDGPYAITLYGLPEQPLVSKFGFTVTVESLEQSAPVDDATVFVIAIDPDGEREWRSPALSFPPNPTSFVGNAPRPPSRAFTTSGDWLLEITVDGAEGRSVVRFPITVAGSARRGTGGAGVMFAIAIGAVVAIAALLTWRIRRIQRRRAKSAG